MIINSRTDFTLFNFLNYDVFYIDLFCGAGGTTEGLEDAVDEFGNKIAYGLACVNHDPVAIQSHAANHPHILHFIEDIRTLDLTPLKALVDEVRRQNPNCVIILWASLECTNFSNAKGGQSRDADSRTLADDLIETEQEPDVFAPRYIPELQPDCIWIENVREFKDNGPLDAKGHPIKELKGTYFTAWRDRIMAMGYNYQDTLINAADLGAYTSRLRLFIQFNKQGLDIVWPEQTHAKDPLKKGLPAGLKKWLPVKDILQLDEHGTSVFTPGRIKSDKTFERLFWGAVKHIAGGKAAYKTARALYYGIRLAGMPPYIAMPSPNEDSSQHIIKYISLSHDGSADNCNQGLAEPFCTLTTQNRYFLSSAQFITKYFSGVPEQKSSSINAPYPTIKTVDNNKLISPCFVDNYYGNGFASSIDSPLPTLRTKDSKTLIHTEQWIASRQGEPYSHNHSINSPAPTLVAARSDPKELVTAKRFIYRDFTHSGFAQSVEQPAGALQTVPKISLVTSTPWIQDDQYNNIGRSVNEPIQTLMAARRGFYLINPQWGVSGSGSVDSPCPTLIARQDKAPLGLVTMENGFASIPVYDTDSYWRVKLKEFMAIYGIADIKMRSLFIEEKLRVQGFPDGYILHGTQTDKNKFIGNSVHTLVAKRIMETFHKYNIERIKKAVA
jgi:DNA (cytosine-5)-methyltransferase 1